VGILSRRGEDLSSLVHHPDRKVQGGFNWSSQHLDDGGGNRWDRDELDAVAFALNGRLRKTLG